jgi:hypothetical protein
MTFPSLYALPACKRWAFAVRRESHPRGIVVVMIVMSALSVHVGDGLVDDGCHRVGM